MFFPFKSVKSAIQAVTVICGLAIRESRILMIFPLLSAVFRIKSTIYGIIFRFNIRGL